MSAPLFQDIRCPICNHKLMEALGISAHLVLRVKCTCRRLVQIREGFMVEIVRDDAPRVINQEA